MAPAGAQQDRAPRPTWLTHDVYGPGADLARLFVHSPRDVGRRDGDAHSDRLGISSLGSTSPRARSLADDDSQESGSRTMNSPDRLTQNIAESPLGSVL